VVTPIEEEEYYLLGRALVAAQRVEFVLYGLAAHASHLPAAQKDKRLKTLTPEAFLRGDPRELKVTLGQLSVAFGDAFLIATPMLENFCEDRNLIAHNYLRVFKSEIRGTQRRDDAVPFLQKFLETAAYWEAILNGLLKELMVAAAAKEGRSSELVLSEQHHANMLAFRKHAEEYATTKLSNTNEDSP
jgi:hypothetical protein